MSEIADKSETTSSVEKTPPSPQEITLSEEEKSLILKNFPDAFPATLTDAEKTTKMQPVLIFKQAFGETSALLNNPTVTDYALIETIATQLKTLDAQKKKEISDALHNIDDFLAHMTQENAKIADFLEAQKKEIINLADYPVWTTKEDQDWYADLLDEFHTTHTQKITSLLNNKSFTPDVSANMSTWLLNRWIGKVDAYVASLAEDKKPDKLDLSRLYAAWPFSEENKIIVGNVALAPFFTELGKQTPKEGVHRDQYGQLMDPLASTSLLEKFVTEKPTDVWTRIKTSIDNANIIKAWKLFAFDKQAELQQWLERVATAMKWAKAPSEAKKMVASLTPMLQTATEGIKWVVDMLTSFFAELEKSWVLQQIKDLFQTWGEFTESLDFDKKLEAEKGEAQKTLAVETAMSQIKWSLTGMDYNENNYKKTWWIKEKLLTLDPSKLETSLKESGISDKNFTEIFNGSEIVNPLQLPEGNRIRQLMVKNMVNALGYDATKKTQTDTALAASPDATFKMIFTAYIDKKHADRTPDAGRDFNASADATQTWLWGERFARAVLKSIFMDESKAKVDYTKKTVVEATEWWTEIMYKLDAMCYHVDTNKKLHFDDLAETTKVGVKIGDKIHEVSDKAIPRETVDLSTVQAPVSVSFLQWDATKSAWDDTNKLENVPIEMGIALKKTEGKYSLSWLDTTKTYETKKVYKKTDNSGNETVSWSNIVTKDAYEISPDATKGTLDHVLLRPTTVTPKLKAPRQKIPLTPATSV